MNYQIIAVLAALCAVEVLGSPSYNHGHDDHQVYSHDDHDHLRYHGPTAIPHVLHDGHIADTHEVAAAKSLHYAAVAKAKAHGGYGHDYSGQYAGEYAGSYGYENTHKYGGDYGYNHGHQHVYSHDDHGHLRYHGPTAIPHVLHDGHIADTHEVAAAKAKHYVAVAKAKTHRGYGHGYSGQYASGYGGYHGYSQDGGYGSGYYGSHGYSHHATPYHGPLAKPVVLHSGYLADTHEVAAAKHHHLEALHSGHHGSYYQHY